MASAAKQPVSVGVADEFPVVLVFDFPLQTGFYASRKKNHGGLVSEEKGTLFGGSDKPMTAGKTAQF
jgi:hypothetical protein